MKGYIPVIGLEIHVELTTKSKMFCSCPAEHFGAPPNTHTCPVCLGLPGALPVPNKAAIEGCLLIGAALGCKVNMSSYFERKNYFYPDLPKAFQLSQYIDPFNVQGKLEIEVDGEVREIGITRAHMEEDTGKIIHAEVDGSRVSMIDFNRSGVPLVEIVTEPDIRSGQEARIFLTKLRQIIRHLGVSDCDMEKGHMRLEPNISVKKPGEKDLPKYKVEVKNINSFKFVESAIEFEIKRHIEILENGETPTQETRGWNEDKSETFSQRVKEEAHDYRYFPEPDVPMIRISESQLSSVRSSLGELPDETKKRFMSEYKLSEYQSELLTRSVEMAKFVDEVEKVLKVKTGENVNLSDVANIIINQKIDVMKTSPEEVVEKAAGEKKIDEVDEEEIDQAVEKAILDNPKALSDYKSGQENAIMFLVGVVMRVIGKKIDAKMVIEKLKKAADNA